MKKGMMFFIFVYLLIMCVSLIYAQGVEIDIAENGYIPGDDVKFKLTLYDENRVKLDGSINYQILNYISEIIEQGSVNSGEEKIFKLPENAWKGHWAVITNYEGKEQKQLFNVGELEKAEIKLEGDSLIITNVGNTPYNKKISISIGNHDETALVPLEVGQTKKIKLTAPAGEYNVRVSDGTEENTFEFEKVSLTGNVIGLESVLGDGFWKRYPLVGLFIGALFLVVVVVLGLKLMQKFVK